MNQYFGMNGASTHSKIINSGIYQKNQISIGFSIFNFFKNFF